jgi:predicted DNA-binding protein YlxM (UPF0122 family)
MISRHDLTSQHKIQLIYDSNCDDGLSQRKLVEKYNISLDSLSDILKRKIEYLNDYETNKNQNVKRKLKDTNAQKLDEQENK